MNEKLFLIHENSYKNYIVNILLQFLYFVKSINLVFDVPQSSYILEKWLLSKLETVLC